MAALVAALDELEEDVRSRVLEWAGRRYSIAFSAPSRTADRGPNGGDSGEVESTDSDEGGSGRFAHFADLIDAVNPTSDVDRALAGGYWFQVVQAEQSFQAQQVNNALKNVGHGVENIARALSNLQEHQPALVRQLSKSGRSKQARKTYKLTTAGVGEIKNRLPQS